MICDSSVAITFGESNSEGSQRVAVKVVSIPDCVQKRIPCTNRDIVEVGRVDIK